jgi:chemotaxis protein methyltransferase CheR
MSEFSKLNDHMESEDIEVKLLLEAIFLKYGTDFRGYSRLSVKRQVLKMVRDNRLRNISELQHKMIWGGDFFKKLLPKFSINVTEHFRDPSFYNFFRDDIVPVLKTYPSLKIWHAGCATGQEVYSMAILLQEENLYANTWIYATDINEKALDIAKQGAYPEKELSQCSKNYAKAGGKKSFFDYIQTQGQNFVMDKKLKENISFFDHNLATDETFVEAHVILCRNVLIYFDEELTRRVVNLFYGSLHNQGYLCLGSRESIMGCNTRQKFKLLNLDEKVYRRYPNALANQAG